jgi:outer membrane protein OmpA-like peptidoglycan-associated protein
VALGEIGQIRRPLGQTENTKQQTWDILMRTDYTVYAPFETLFKPAVAFLVLAAASAFGQNVTHEPPAELSFLPSLMTVRKNIPYETWSEIQFPPPPNEGTAQRGKHWYLIGEIQKEADRQKVWDAIKPAFLQNGWTVVREERRIGQFINVLRYARNGVQAWANLIVEGGTPTFVRMDVIEVGPIPISLTLAAPGPAPEKMSPEKGDFPYLAPLPGSKFHSGGVHNSPFSITPPGAAQSEMIAPGSMFRYYDLPGISTLLFTTAYSDALTKAGWVVAVRGGSITAHYGKNGRNIWAYLIDSLDGYSIDVADTGTDLGAGLAKACHVALYGVLFDFNKSTLQPASDGALQQVVALLAADKALKVEVQGHTDNVGNDAYNQTLSDARAKAVLTWLTQHGVAADRLTAKGYGKTKPVADNGNDEGRAKNRRVEIADPRCTPKGN